MSAKRRFLVRCFLGGVILCLIAGLATVLTGDYRWLPAGLRVTLAQLTGGFSRESCATGNEPGPNQSLNSGEEEVSLDEIADQSEPDPSLAVATTRKKIRLPGFETDVDDVPERTRGGRTNRDLNAERQSDDEGIDPDSDPVMSPASRQRLAQRRPVRLLPPEPDTDPFDAQANATDTERPGVTTAAYEERAGRTKSDKRSAIRKQNFDEASSDTAVPPVAAARPKSGTPPAPITDTPAPQNAALMPMPEIDQLIVAENYVLAQRELSKWYWRTPSMRGALHKKLDDLAQSLYFSPQPLFHEPYVIQPGDQLRVVAQRYKLSWEYLAKLNRVDAKKIRTGQKLKVVDGPFAVLVTLANHELIVHLNGSFVKSYRVGVGKEGTSPIGTFTVKTKLMDPTYYGPDGVVMANDDPQNPLGERWIDIGDSFGIHGTIDPESIGRNESRGCIRMLNSDVEEVYDLLVIGSQVKIQK